MRKFRSIKGSVRSQTSTETISRRQIVHSIGVVTGMALIPIPPFLFQGCTKDQPSSYTFLSDEEFQTILHVTEEIFPSLKSNSPLSGRSLTIWIDKMITDTLNPEEQQNFRGGLQEILKDFQADNDLLKIEPGQNWKTFLVKLDADAYKNNHDRPALNFYRKVKAWTILGVFTARETMEKLNYHAIPGDYRGCISISDDEKVYVDNNVSG